MTLSELLVEQAGLDAGAVDHLQLLLTDWQILADLSFADLLLFVATSDEASTYLCAGQMRPYTAQTLYLDDLVGQVFTGDQRPIVPRAFAERRVIRDVDPDWSSGVPIREEAIPVCFRDRVIGVVSREANVSAARSPSELELTYLQTAGELAQMLAEGRFPYHAVNLVERESSPRVGDGVMRLDADGIVHYASPNAISAYRRLGRLDHLVGQHFGVFDPDHDDMLRALAEGEPIEHEVEASGAAVVRRLLPLVIAGRVTGGLLLVREVTDVRHRERALRLKDATIREIHHRVKNNLQTVASLLRLQGRRLHSQEARGALAESVRRISSIAMVHETLSQEPHQRVEFAQITRRIVDMLGDGLSNPDVPLRFDISGDPGSLPAEVATPLALVLTELLQNSVEHAYPQGQAGPDESGARGEGRVLVAFEPGTTTLRVTVADEGVGLPPGRSLESIANLGLRIARTLVVGDLGGTIAPLPAAGTTIELVIPLPR